MSDHDSRLPREDLIRAVGGNVELRDATDDTGPVMNGHFAVFDQWTEIKSVWEGNFMERFVPGAFRKTFRENRDRIRVLFQHGMDPQVGDKPLGPITDLREDDEGAAYEVPLLDASYVRDQVLPGLEAGLYGASFRFKVMREEIEEEPKASEDNPNGLPERTVKEAQVMEFGPVTFPAYAGATAGVRSLTDDFIQRCIDRDPERLRAMLDQAHPLDARDGDETAPSEGDAATNESHLTDERREPQDPPAPVPLTTRKVVRKYLTPRKEHSSWAIPH
jgi:HK97 family phage prohead protease